MRIYILKSETRKDCMRLPAIPAEANPQNTTVGQVHYRKTCNR
jgi:hypothetical protein